MLHGNFCFYLSDFICSVPPIIVISPLQFVLNVYGQVGTVPICSRPLYYEGENHSSKPSWIPNQKATGNDSSGLSTRGLCGLGHVSPRPRPAGLPLLSPWASGLGHGMLYLDSVGAR